MYFFSVFKRNINIIVLFCRHKKIVGKNAFYIFFIRTRNRRGKSVFALFNYIYSLVIVNSIRHHIFMVVPVVGCIKRHCNNAQIIFVRARHQAPPRPLCKTGFHTVAVIGQKQKFVVISECPAVCSALPRHFFLLCRHNFAKFLVLHSVARNHRQVVCSCVMPLFVQSVRIFKRRVHRADFFRRVVHKTRKIFNRTRNVKCKRHRRVVSRRKHKPVNKVFNRDFFAVAKIH